MYTFDTDDGLPVRSGIIHAAFAMADVHAVMGGLVDRTITDESARTLASQWQSPADPQTTALASGLAYDTDDLLDEIAQHKAAAEKPDDVKALDCLVVWAQERKGAWL